MRVRTFLARAALVSAWVSWSGMVSPRSPAWPCSKVAQDNCQFHGLSFWWPTPPSVPQSLPVYTHDVLMCIFVSVCTGTHLTAPPISKLCRRLRRSCATARKLPILMCPDSRVYMSGLPSRRMWAMLVHTQSPPFVCTAVCTRSVCAWYSPMFPLYLLHARSVV